VKKISILIIVLCLLLPGFVALSHEKILEIYNSIAAMSKKQTPLSYRVKIENKSFKEALEDLPDDILTGEGPPSVIVQFHRGEGEKIVIENIKSEYASLFSMYEDYLKFSGISKVQNPAEFKAMIDKKKVSFYKEDSFSIVVQAWDPEKEEKDNNYALFTLDKKNWVINKAVYYLDGVPYVQAENSYKAYGKYYLPYKIVVTNLNESTSEVFLFKDYQFDN